MHLTAGSQTAQVSEGAKVGSHFGEGVLPFLPGELDIVLHLRHAKLVGSAETEHRALAMRLVEKAIPELLTTEEFVLCLKLATIYRIPLPEDIWGQRAWEASHELNTLGDLFELRGAAANYSENRRVAINRNTGSRICSGEDSQLLDPDTLSAAALVEIAAFGGLSKTEILSGTFAEFKDVFDHAIGELAPSQRIRAISAWAQMHSDGILTKQDFEQRILHFIQNSDLEQAQQIVATLQHRGIRLSPQAASALDQLLESSYSYQEWEEVCQTLALFSRAGFSPKRFVEAIQRRLRREELDTSTVTSLCESFFDLNLQPRGLIPHLRAHLDHISRNRLAKVAGLAALADLEADVVASLLDAPKTMHTDEPRLQVQILRRAAQTYDLEPPRRLRNLVHMLKNRSSGTPPLPDHEVCSKVHRELEEALPPSSQFLRPQVWLGEELHLGFRFGCATYISFVRDALVQDEDGNSHLRGQHQLTQRAGSGVTWSVEKKDIFHFDLDHVELSWNRFDRWLSTLGG